jgi:hypothetical protein
MGVIVPDGWRLAESRLATTLRAGDDAVLLVLAPIPRREAGADAVRRHANAHGGGTLALEPPVTVMIDGCLAHMCLGRSASEERMFVLFDRPQARIPVVLGARGSVEPFRRDLETVLASLDATSPVVFVPWSD